MSPITQTLHFQTKGGRHRAVPTAKHPLLSRAGLLGLLGAGHRARAPAQPSRRTPSPGHGQSLSRHGASSHLRALRGDRVDVLKGSHAEITFIKQQCCKRLNKGYELSSSTEMMRFPKRGAGARRAGAVSHRSGPRAHGCRTGPGPAPRPVSTVPVPPAPRDSSAEEPIPARPRTRAAQGAPRRAGKHNSRRSYGNTLPGARRPLPAPTGRLCPPCGPRSPARTGGGSHITRALPPANPGSWNRRPRNCGERAHGAFVAWIKTYSHHPEVAQSLPDEVFKCQQHPKPRGGERHSSDDSNSAPGV